MPRVKAYIETDVLTEAKKRIYHIFDLFDTVVVMFSRGKDSLATLHLTYEVMQERGITKPLDVVFRDEELIPNEVIDFVDEYRRKDWIKMVRFTVPLASTKYTLGVCRSYVQWDPARPRVRPKPEWAESLAPGDLRVFDQYTMDAYTAQKYRGKIAFLAGVHARRSRSFGSLLRQQAQRELYQRHHGPSRPPGQPVQANLRLGRERRLSVLLRSQDQILLALRSADVGRQLAAGVDAAACGKREEVR
jgi:predicted phosphoadenosine phosphosulfate sulfurtransferase